jgi:hypothetical protein
MVKGIITVCFCWFMLASNAQQSFGEPQFWPENQAFDSITNWGYHATFQLPAHQKNDSLSWFRRKWSKEHFVTHRDSALMIFIDPMIDVSVNKASNRYFQNGRGLHAGFVIENKIEAETWLMENQSGKLPSWLIHHENKQSSIYGYGRTKLDKDTLNYDFAWVMARLSVALKPWWKAEVGYGRHHIGLGYRSLLLSNQSIPYPYILNTWTHKKFKYTHMLGAWNTLMRSGITANTEAPFLIQKNKVDEWSYQVSKDISVSYISGTLWDDNKNYTVAQHAVFNAPIPGLSNVLGDSLFVLNGFQAHLKKKNWLLYGQLMFGQKKSIKQAGLQLGVLLKKEIKEHTIFARMEYNTVPSEMYSSSIGSWSHQSYYSGFVGNQGRELLMRLQYQYRRIMASSGLVLSMYPEHTEDIIGEKGIVNKVSFELQYTINQKNGLAFFVETLYTNKLLARRNATNEFLKEANELNSIKWVSLGLRTSLSRIFQDY